VWSVRQDDPEDDEDDAAFGSAEEDARSIPSPVMEGMEEGTAAAGKAPAADPTLLPAGNGAAAAAAFERVARV
jgi:hypothetical protein